MKTYICNIYGGGTPLYLVCAENEQDAWKLIKVEFYKKYKKHLIQDSDAGHLHKIDFVYSNKEMCLDLY